MLSETSNVPNGEAVELLPEPLDGRHDEWFGIVNLTPHDIRVVAPWAPSDGADVILNRLPGAEPIRIPEIRPRPGDRQEGAEQHVGGGVWCVKTMYSPDINLPPQIEGRRYVVSQVVLQCLKIAGIDRPDFMAPDTGEGAIRDASGRIIGTRGFVRL